MIMIFYGVHIRDKDLSFLFDAIRLLSQPDALRKTHITVRGPYKHRIDIERYNSKGLGDLGLIQPGNFFLNRQRTVFIHCDIVGIRDIWNKPDYQDGIAHLTLYDGDSSAEAKSIVDLLSMYPWNIWTRPTKLVEIEKKTINTESINILEQDFTRRFIRFFNFSRDVSYLRKIAFHDRLKMIHLTLEYMRTRYMVPRI